MVFLLPALFTKFALLFFPMSLSVSGLTRIYGNQRAIDQVSFKAEAGQVLGFLGPNGAGKTTTMKIITCFIPPDEGKVELDGYNIFDHPIEIRRKIGYLPEHNPLYTDMYVWEYLEFAGRLCGMEKNQLKIRIPEMIEMTGLGREQHKKIAMLSKGYRQRVGLAQAMIHDPQVLILDEPTTGLDPNQIIEIRELIRSIGKEKTIIFSTHILSEVEAIADRVVIIDRGKIVADESMEELQAGGSEENIVKVEFEKEEFETTALSVLPGVIQVRKDSPIQFTIRSNRETDVRRKLFEESNRQDNPIFSLMKVRRSLEDIFRSLTQK